MNLLNLTRDLNRLSAADAVVLDSYVRHLLGKTGAYALAGFIGVIGLALLGLSAFWLFEPALGRAGAAALIGSVGCALAAFVFLFAAHLNPGRDLALALEIRRSAIEALEHDVAHVPSRLEPAAYPARPAIEALISAVLVPLIVSLLQGLRKSQTEPSQAEEAARPLDHTPPSET